MDFKLKAGMPGMPSIPPQLPVVLFVLGAGVAGFGMLVLIYDWLVRWLVAGVFLVLGVVLLMTAARARRMLG